MQQHTYQEIIFHDHKDLHRLQEAYLFPNFIVESLFDSSEISHLRVYKEKYYLILSFPPRKILYHPEQTHLHPIAIIIDENKILFLHNKNVNLSIFLDKLTATQPVEILYEFLSYVFTKLENETILIKERLEEMELKIIASPDNKEIKELFSIQKSVLHFQTAITGLVEMLHSFQSTQYNLLWNPEHEYYYSDIKIECNQLNKNINMMNDTLQSLLDTAGSIQANNLSKRMKTLTSLTIVISIPTLITGFYGMNINLPFQNHPYSLAIVSIASFIITILVTIYLYKKDLF